MSAKAPDHLGGTAVNKEEIFQLEDTTTEKNDSVIEELGSENSVMEMESLCMNCHENGNTRMMLTMIPYFREVIVMSFECDKCGFKNNEIQFGGTIQEKGCRIEVDITTREDLNRQMIKSDNASVCIPDVDFEIPAKTQRGCINTIEGILTKAVSDLRENQEERRAIDPETTAKIDEVLAQLTLRASGITLPFKIILDDPAGNSYIENPIAPKRDENMKVTHYDRSEAQDLAVGLQPDASHEHSVPSEEPIKLPPRNEGLDSLTETNFAKKEVVRFPTDCHACAKPGETCMCVTDIPHFKEIILMSFNCEHCGFRSNEVKGGGAIPPQGEEIILHVTGEDKEMLDRDVLKSDSAYVNIPEIDLEMQAGSLGGIYTTVEGLLDKIRANIEEGNPFAVGDSDGGRSKLTEWLEKLDALRNGNKFTLIIRDPLANSFIYSPHGAAADDPNMSSSQYTRSFEEDEDLGLNDINTEEYSTGYEDKPIVSDKMSMPGGGTAIPQSAYHPNPNAVQETAQGEQTEL